MAISHAILLDVLDSCCNQDALLLLHFECFIPANHGQLFIYNQISQLHEPTFGCYVLPFSCRKSGETFGDSLAKFRGLQDLCQSLGVRVGPVLLNRASAKVLFLGFNDRNR